MGLFDTLARLTGITRLDVSHTHVQGELDVQVARKFGVLEFLITANSSVHISFGRPFSLQSSQTLLPNLIMLDISGSQQDYPISDFLTWLSYSGSLNEVRAQDCGFEGPLASLSDSTVRMDGQYILAKNSPLSRSLGRLYLSGNNITSVALPGPRVHTLDVSNNPNLTDVDHQSLFATAVARINLENTGLRLQHLFDQGVLRMDRAARMLTTTEYQCYGIQGFPFMRITPSTLAPDSLCKCNAGYSGNGVNCSPCPIHTFKPDAGDSNCQRCGWRKYSEPGSSECHNSAKAIAMIIFLGLCSLPVTLWLMRKCQLLASKRMEVWQHRCYVKNEVESVLAEFEALSSDMRVGRFPVSPTTMDVFRNHPAVFGNPIDLLDVDRLDLILFATLKFMDEYIRVGETEWDFSVHQQADSSDDFINMCTQAYSTAEGVSQAREPQEQAQWDEELEENRCKAVNHFSKLDPPPDRDESLRDRVHRLVSMYKQSQECKDSLFDPLLKLASATAAAHAQKHGVPTGDLAYDRCAPHKGIGRLCEKDALRPKGGNPWDCCRGQVVAGTKRQLRQAWQCIARNPHVRVHGVNNRFKNPTPNGWRDVSLYISFHGDGISCSDVVCEIQFVHKNLLLVREDMHAHDAYDGARFAAEVRKRVTGRKIAALPDSQHRDGVPKSAPRSPLASSVTPSPVVEMELARL